ncbi:hypothetical protein [Nocardia asiatica]|nr:hypothetical protein [Nocardia asiatica]
MPIYLPTREAPARGPDGRGWNRISLAAPYGIQHRRDEPVP